MERPDEPGQLEGRAFGVCYSRRVGRGHRGRESGAVVSERREDDHHHHRWRRQGPANSEEEEEEEENM